MPRSPALPGAAALTVAALALGLPPPPPAPARAPAAEAAPRLAPRPSARWAGDRTPPPTEHWLDVSAEKDNKKRRKSWFKEIHKAPPGVDWQAVERDNGLAQLAKRNALAGLPRPPEAGAWVERGSDNNAGRTHVARTSPDGERLYVGSSLGGLWRGTPDGEDWTPLGDNLYGGVQWLEVMAGDDGDVLLVMTDGGLVHRSTDDGETWEEPSGLGSPWWVRRLAMRADGSETIFVVTSSDAGTKLFRSTDQGASFDRVYAYSAYYGDAWIPRDGGGSLYIVDAGVTYRSDDDGETWDALGTIASGTSRAELVGSEAGAPTLYAVLDTSTLYRSDDGGETWAAVASLSDYWAECNASITDPDLFVYGGVELHVSRDGGSSFRTPNNWWDYYDDPATLLHADMMGLDVRPDADLGEIWTINTDGGPYRSDDQLRSFSNLGLRGLRVSQYYDVLTSSADPTHVAAGAQDQGYQITNGVEQDDDVYEFDQILSGDYGHLTSGDGTHAYVYSVYPGFILITVGEDSPTLYDASFPSGEDYVPWLPPIVADPDDREAFFFPASKLYRYPRSRTEWYPSLYSEHEFAATSGEYVSRLAFSPVDSRRAWAATSAGRIFWSDDHGVTWSQSESLGPDENWYYGQAIAPSRTDVDTVTIGGSGYGFPAVYRSTDGGVSFAPWSDGLPDTLVYTLVEAPDGSGRVFAGTQTALYMRGPDDAEWQDVTGAEAPVTIYWDCEALTAETTIRCATYGRGIWDYQVPEWPDEPERAAGAEGGEEGGGVEGGGVEGSGEEGSGEGGVPDTGGTDPKGGCGCAGSPGGASGLGALALLGLSLSRRRRPR